MELNEEELEELKKILLMPIVHIRGKNKIEIDFENNQIRSTGEKDQDMSDVAQQFYKVLYDFKDDSWLKNGFAGDTMNSCKYACKIVSEEKREEWNSKYHCLANFWVLPSEVGRSTFKDYSKNSGGVQSPTIASFNKGRKDYMDRFLDIYMNEEKFYQERYPSYYQEFPKDKFGDKHFITGIFIDDDKKVISFSKISETEKVNLKYAVENIIDVLIGKIEERASSISNSDKAEMLRDLFYVNICNDIKDN